MAKILVMSVFAAAFAWPAHGQNSATVPAGIEALHQDDITATVARDANALTALFDDDAVLLQPGIPPIIGKAAIKDFMQQALANGLVNTSRHDQRHRNHSTDKRRGCLKQKCDP